MVSENSENESIDPKPYLQNPNWRYFLIYQALKRVKAHADIVSFFCSELEQPSSTTDEQLEYRLSQLCQAFTDVLEAMDLFDRKAPEQAGQPPDP